MKIRFINLNILFFFLKAVKKHLKTAKNKKILCDAIMKLSIDGDLLEPKYKAHNL